MSTNIINLLEHDIPEFLRTSPNLLSLITDEVFPSGGIEVPADCIKTDTQVGNISDLEGLLKTVRYWHLPDLLPDLLDLHVFVFDPKNEADVVQVLDNFKAEFPYVNTLLPLISCGMEEKLSFAAGRGFVPLLDSLCQVEKALESNEKPVNWQHVTHSAATEGKLSCLQFLRAQGYPWGADSLPDIVKNGHLDCLVFFVNDREAEGDAPRVDDLFRVAAESNHVHILSYLHGKFGLPDERTQEIAYCSAATSGHLEAMDFLEGHGFATCMDVFNSAAANGHIHVLQHLISKFDVPDAEEAQGAWRGAAEGGHWEVLRFLQEHVSPLVIPGDANELEAVEDSASVMYFAVESGSISCVAYLRELGHPWHRCFTKSAAECGNSDLFWYLIEQGCPCSFEKCACLFARKGSLRDLVRYYDKRLPWGADTCDYAALARSLECLQFLVENGCPINYDKICECAAVDIHCLTYAHQLGGKLTPAGAVQAASSGAIECLAYMYANGCTFTVDVANTAVLRVELFQFLLDAGCPVNEETCVHAATRPWLARPNGTAEAQLACLRLLHERGCPWDERTCIAAIENQFFEGLQYAVDHGCPWGERTRAAAADI